MLDKRTEFLICGHFDGTLCAEEEDELLKRIAADPAARRAFEQHRALDAALRSGQPPAADWEGLAGQVSAATARLAPPVGESPPACDVDESIEQEIVALVSGELGPDERTAVEERLAGDAAARELLRRHEALDALLRSWPGTPDVDHDALRYRIRQRIDAADAPATIPIGGHAARRGLRLALAASVLLAGGLAAWLALRPDGRVVRGEPLIQVVVVAPERAAGAPAVEVSISPSDELVRGQYDYYSTGLVAMPTRVEIQSSNRPLPRTDVQP